MAGIEKICEYSGVHAGPAMYDYKRNQLQIMPEYRKLLRYQPHTLYFLQPDPVNFWNRTCWHYCLYLPCLEGRVEGFYWNWSTDKGTVLRKLKRLLRQDLNITKVPVTLNEYCVRYRSSSDLMRF